MKKEDLITYINQIIAQYKDQTTVLFEKKPTKNDVHPTMKPVNLVGRLMRNSSKPGWNVLDLFGGSGSTLMAAEQIGRRCLMRLAFGYGNKLEAFKKVMTHLGAKPCEMGDCSFELEFMDDLRIRFILWEGDDEFPPSSQILFSDSCCHSRSCIP